jgi:ABC-type spermidine/putrescine transport system permease subunit II
VLLGQCLRSPLDVVDVFLGALDAHLQLLNGETLSWRMMNMLNKLRTSLLMVFAAYIGFIVAGFSLVGLADDSPMMPLMKTNPALAAAWTTIQVGAVVALLAVVIGGMPLALTVVRGALAGDRGGRRLLLVPVVSFVVLVLYLGFVLLAGTGRLPIPGIVKVMGTGAFPNGTFPTGTFPNGTFPEGNRLMLEGLMLVFILGAIASTLAVWKAVSAADSEQETFHAFGRALNVKIYSFAFVPAVIATISMLVMLLATLAWGWLSFSALPQVFAGNFGPWGTSTQIWYIGILVVMAACSGGAVFGLRRGRPRRSQ